MHLDYGNCDDGYEDYDDYYNYYDYDGYDYDNYNYYGLAFEVHHLMWKNHVSDETLLLLFASIQLALFTTSSSHVSNK